MVLLNKNKMSSNTWKKQAEKAREVVQMHLKWGYTPLQVWLHDDHFDVRKHRTEICRETRKMEEILAVYDAGVEKAAEKEKYCYGTPIRICLKEETLKMFNQLDRYFADFGEIKFI